MRALTGFLVFAIGASGLHPTVMRCVSAAEPDSVWLRDTPEPAAVVPPSPDEIREAIERGRQFLQQQQNANGSWGSATSTKQLNIYAPIPGAHHAFRAAVTSLAICAFLRSPDDAGQAATQHEWTAALSRAEDWLLNELPKVKRANHDAIYNVWAHAFSMEALAELIRYHEARGESVDMHRSLVAEQIALMQRFESVDNGWGYYDFRAHAQRPSSRPTSFTTATALVGLKEVQSVGIEVPDELVERALACVKRTQKPDFSYYYSYSGPTRNAPMRSINRPGGSLGRSQACNFALRIWGDEQITDRVLDVWLDRLFARNLWLDIGRKRPIPHESYFAVAGYFFYYGHWYAARCIDQLPEQQRQPHRDQLARLILDLQEKDGSWWDYPFYAYHQEYGTAMAIMTLSRCLPDEAANP